MKRRLAVAALGLSLAWACGDDEKPPPPVTPQPDAGEGGNGGSGAAGSGNGGTGTGGDGGAPGEGGAGTSAGGTAGAGAVGGTGPTGGTAGAGGEGGEGDAVPPCPSDLADPPSSGTFSCDPAIEWGPAIDVAIAGNAARLVAVTPDELTMAWLAISFIGNTYGVADRATASEPFGAGQELMVTNLVALSPDGLRLVGLSEDRSQFYELARTARGEMFGAPDAGAFTTLNSDAAASDLTFSTAVIAPNDRTLYYAVRGSADGEHPVRVSSRSGTEPWPVGTPLEVCELTTVGSAAREPTGISADGRTLFYFDQARGRERASWRETPNGPFVWSTDLGDRNLAQPNTGCSRLYFTLVTGPSFSDPI